MSISNKNVQVFEGEVKLLDSKEIKVIDAYVIIDFAWFPQPGAQIRGVLNVNEIDQNLIMGFALLMEGLAVGKGRLRTIMEVQNTYDHKFVDQSPAFEIEALMDKNTVIGDRTINVQELFFSIPNLKINITTNIKESSLLTLESDKYKIELRDKSGFPEKENNLSKNGGYLITHTGVASRSDGKSISFEESRKMTLCLSQFLSFLNGSSTAPILISGCSSGNRIWTDLHYNDITANHPPISWLPHNIEKVKINYLWKSFVDAWNDDFDFIQSILFWYLQANERMAKPESAIVLAQSALELIYNKILVESKMLLIGKDVESLSAANKIRLILFDLRLASSVPSEMSKMRALQQKEGAIFIDAPEIIVEIRNALVHADKKKRMKLKNYETDLRIEALNIYLWYIELSVLKLLKYEGIYINRTNNFRIENVPWTQQ